MGGRWGGGGAAAAADGAAGHAGTPGRPRWRAADEQPAGAGSSVLSGSWLALKEGAHGIRACNKLACASDGLPISIGGAEASSLWSFGDDGCVRSWRLDDASGFVETTPRNGEAAACLGR